LRGVVGGEVLLLVGIAPHVEQLLLAGRRVVHVLHIALADTKEVIGCR
jgi:hypothetical protein